MSVVYGASLNGFILGCRKILFIDGAHLSGPYKGPILSAVALDADDHLFGIAYAVVSAENVDEWFQFFTLLRECLGRMQPVIMSDRNQGLLSAVPRVFEIENQSNCLRHRQENFLTYGGKLGIRRQASKDLLKEVFNRIAYASTGVEYGVGMEELRKYKLQWATWVECNEPER